MERSPQELLEFSLAADDPASILPVWDAYPQVRTMIHSPAGHRARARCPTANGSGGLWRSPISSAIANFAAGGSTPRSASRSGYGAVMKVFLPTGGATGASLVFDTTRSRFTETDRLTLERLVPHLGQLRRNALARRTYPALMDSTAAARMRLLRLTPRERVVLARAAAGETNAVIAQALFVSPGPSASTLNTSTTSSKSAPAQKRPRSTPKSEWSWRARVWTPSNAGGVAELAADDGGDHFEAGDAVRADGGRVFGQDREVGQLARLDRALDVLLLAGIGGTPGVGAQRLGGGDRFAWLKGAPEAVRRLTMLWMPSSGAPSATGRSELPGSTIPASRRLRCR